jgi:hypothetical protein
MDSNSIIELVAKAKAEIAALNDALDVLAAVPSSEQPLLDAEHAIAELERCMDQVWRIQNPDPAARIREQMGEDYFIRAALEVQELKQKRG